jgi:hypothetical protein
MERRRKLVNFLGCLSVAFVFAGCVEGQDGGLTLWNLISLAMAFVLGFASKWLNDNVKFTKPGEDLEEETKDKEEETK